MPRPRLATSPTITFNISSCYSSFDYGKHTSLLIMAEELIDWDLAEADRRSPPPVRPLPRRLWPVTDGLFSTILAPGHQTQDPFRILPRN
jgi:hypothetical protein